MARIVSSEVYRENGDLRALLGRRTAIRAELLGLVHSASPDLPAIERLRAQEHDLSMQIMQESYEATSAAISKLSEEERLSYLRSAFPKPPRIVPPRRAAEPVEGDSTREPDRRNSDKSSVGSL